MGARVANLSALNKSKMHNEYVGNSNVSTPQIHSVYRGMTNDAPVLTNSQMLMSSMHEPSAYNRYSRLENSAFSYPTMIKMVSSYG